MASRPGKRSKYNSKTTTIDGINFDSRLEAAYYLQLETEKKMGTVKYYLRQVPFHLPGGIQYRVDFMVVRPQGNTIRIDYIDVKGVITQTYRMKKKIVEDLYPVKIIEVTKADIENSFIASAVQISEHQKREAACES